MLHSSGVIACEWVFMSLAYIMVSARLWVRLFLKRTRLILSDMFLLIALVSAQGLLVCDTLTYQMGQMNNFTHPDERLLKIRFATNYFFDFGIYFPKFSILALYYAVVPSSSSSRRLRVVLHVLASITVASSLFTLFADTFWCGPDPSVNWRDSADSCTAFDSMQLMRANWSLNFVTEVLNLLFPFQLIASLMLQTKREKLSLAALFAMGFVTLAVSIARFVNMVYMGNAMRIYIWATTEFCISIMIVALTALRPLLKKVTRIISTTLASSTTGGDCHTTTASKQMAGVAHVDLESDSWWSQGQSSTRSQAVAYHQSNDSRASEMGLMGRGGIMKIEEVTVTSERADRLREDSSSSDSRWKNSIGTTSLNEENR